MDDTMHDPWIDRLSEYLDGELPPAERDALEAHLAECGDCRSLLVELGAVVARAAAVEERPPREDLWDGIAERIRGTAPAPRLHVTGVPQRRTRGVTRRLAFSFPELVAAAIGLVVLGGAGGWLAAPLLRDDAAIPYVTTVSAPDAPRGPAAPAGPLHAAAVAEQTTDAAVAELEAALAAGQRRLSPATVATLEASLATIDTAIADARAAVETDPGNTYLQTHLADIMRRKVRLLQHAAALASAET